MQRHAIVEVMNKLHSTKTSKTRRLLIGFAGWAVLLVGIVMIPYPGPGWIVVFIGLSILATEFDWARDLHDYAHKKYNTWQDWISAQPLYIRAVFWLLTCMTVIITVWLVNGYGLMNDWMHLGQNWLQSPFVR